MKEKLPTLALIVSLGINILQFVSSEAREWYAVMQQSKPSVSTSDDKMIVDALPVTRIFPKKEITKAEGTE